MPIFALSEKISFPPPHMATREGLLAVGGDLSLQRLLHAYKLGIFPWYSPGDPILWWSPDPRLVLYPDQLKVSKSLKRTIKNDVFQVTMDTAFSEVITNCAESRTEHGPGTWIDEEMIEAYCRLHQEGYAHSVEAWHEGKLAGGLYGVSLGNCFFGESMFTKVSNASKVALVALAEFLRSISCELIDCQVTTAHLISFGAVEIPRKRFLKQLENALEGPAFPGQWKFPWNLPSRTP
jgi:leucyl/phenylalanyl-tRNA---protein transferase